MNTKQYIRLAMGSPMTITSVDGDEYENQQPLKDEWLRAGKKILKQLAKELGLVEGEYDLRVNKGGCAVSGDVYLHSDHFYVNLSQTCLGPDWGFMWRLCNGRKDYTGGQNRWAAWDNLLDLPKFASIMKEAK